jgi:hypothetical protein
VHLLNSLDIIAYNFPFVKRWSQNIFLSFPVFPPKRVVFSVFLCYNPKNTVLFPNSYDPKEALP